MCGIAGWLDRYSDLREKEIIINKMSETLSKRGPDENGIYLNSENDVCLIHRRLTVISPEGGKQPMTYKSSNRNCTIVYNGELYNTKELRYELINAGYEFSSLSDTEVLLKSYIHFGKDCVNKLNGIYAFAIWDSENKYLFMARDRIGVKPLFYHEYKGGLVFGSEIETILANPIVKPVVDENGLNEIFFLGPARTSGFTPFKYIKELKAGECATYKNGILRKEQYFKLEAMEHTDSISQTIEKTRFLLQDSIERQLISDVPLCCFLSGGLDSSIICKTAADYYKNNNKGSINTYSVDYKDNAKFFEKSVFQPNSDNEYITLMSEFIDSNHTEVLIDNTLLFEALYPSLLARDTPGMADVDSSLLLFCKEVKKDYTVALSGECADEMFGGYPWYHNEDILFEECFPWSRNLEIRRNILKDGLLKNGEDYVHNRYLETINQTDKLENESKLEKRMKEMYMLNFNWFMQCLLDRKDRMSMYSGLEVRVPFCDYRLIEYSYNMPWSMKALNNREKGILRTAFDDLLPYEIVHRKKSPYPKTHNPKYFNLVSSEVIKILDDKNSLISIFLDRERIMNIINNPNGIVAPWYGQLMKAPQILAYIIQIDYWCKKYNVELC